MEPRTSDSAVILDHELSSRSLNKKGAVQVSSSTKSSSRRFPKMASPDDHDASSIMSSNNSKKKTGAKSTTTSTSNNSSTHRPRHRLPLSPRERQQVILPPSLHKHQEHPDETRSPTMEDSALLETTVMAQTTIEAMRSNDSSSAYIMDFKYPKSMKEEGSNNNPSAAETLLTQNQGANKTRLKQSLDAVQSMYPQSQQSNDSDRENNSSFLKSLGSIAPTTTSTTNGDEDKTSAVIIKSKSTHTTVMEDASHAMGTSRSEEVSGLVIQRNNNNNNAQELDPTLSAGLLHQMTISDMGSQDYLYDGLQLSAEESSQQPPVDNDTMNLVSRYIDLLHQGKGQEEGGKEADNTKQGAVSSYSIQEEESKDNLSLMTNAESMEPVTQPAPRRKNRLLECLAATNNPRHGSSSTPEDTADPVYREVLELTEKDDDESVCTEDLSPEVLDMIEEYAEFVAVETEKPENEDGDQAIPSLLEFVKTKRAISTTTNEPRILEPGGAISSHLIAPKTPQCDPPSAHEEEEQEAAFKNLKPQRKDPPMNTVSSDMDEESQSSGEAKLLDPDEEEPAYLVTDNSGELAIPLCSVATDSTYEDLAPEEPIRDLKKKSTINVDTRYPNLLYSPSSRSVPPTPEGQRFPPMSRLGKGKTTNSPKKIDHNDPLLNCETFTQFYNEVVPSNKRGIIGKALLLHVMRFSFPFLEDGKPTEDELVGLKSEVITMGLRKGPADRLFDLLRIFYSHRNGIEQAPSDEMEATKKRMGSDGRDESMECFFAKVLASNLLEKDLEPRSVEENQDKVTDGELDVVEPTHPVHPKTEAHNMGDLDPPDHVGDSSSVVSDGPWWEVPSKLGSRLLDIDASTHEDDSRSESDSSNNEEDSDNMSHDGSESASGDDDGNIERALAGIAARAQADEQQENKSPPNVENEIKEFWKTREGTKEEGQKTLTREKDEPDELCELESDSHSLPAYTEIPKPRYMSLGDMEPRWIARRNMAMRSNNKAWLSKTNEIRRQTDEPPSIDGVHASKNIAGIAKGWRSRIYREVGAQWFLSHEERANHHSGFSDIDVHSLYEMSAVQARPHRHDARPWEYRDVKQLFLDERSIGYQRNWFGRIRYKKGNKMLDMPVCRPQAMEMPMRAPDWTDEWFRTPSLIPLESNLGSFDGDRRPTHRNHCALNDDDSASWEDIPTCGKLRNIRLKPSDKITRLTPDLTSSVRRSRWRKKHFPVKGSFPY